MYSIKKFCEKSDCSLYRSSNFTRFVLLYQFDLSLILTFHYTWKPYKREIVIDLIDDCDLFIDPTHMSHDSCMYCALIIVLRNMWSNYVQKGIEAIITIFFLFTHCALQDVHYE